MQYALLVTENSLVYKYLFVLTSLGGSCRTFRGSSVSFWSSECLMSQWTVRKRCPSGCLMTKGTRHPVTWRRTIIWRTETTTNNRTAVSARRSTISSFFACPYATRIWAGTNWHIRFLFYITCFYFIIIFCVINYFIITTCFDLRMPYSGYSNRRVIFALWHCYVIDIHWYFCFLF